MIFSRSLTVTVFTPYIARSNGDCLGSATLGALDAVIVLVHHTPLCPPKTKTFPFRRYSIGISTKERYRNEIHREDIITPQRPVFIWGAGLFSSLESIERPVPCPAVTPPNRSRSPAGYILVSQRWKLWIACLTDCRNRCHWIRISRKMAGISIIDFHKKIMVLPIVQVARFSSGGYLCMDCGDFCRCTQYTRLCGGFLSSGASCRGGEKKRV